MKIGRNDPCPCGSGSKEKKCCLLARPTRLALEGLMTVEQCMPCPWSDFAHTLASCYHLPAPAVCRGAERRRARVRARIHLGRCLRQGRPAARVNRKAISLWETGEREPVAVDLLRMLDALYARVELQLLINSGKFRAHEVFSLSHPTVPGISTELGLPPDCKGWRPLAPDPTTNIASDNRAKQPNIAPWQSMAYW